MPLWFVSLALSYRSQVPSSLLPSLAWILPGGTIAPHMHRPSCPPATRPPPCKPSFLPSLGLPLKFCSQNTPGILIQGNFEADSRAKMFFLKKSKFSFIYLFIFLAILGIIEPRALHMQGKHSKTELHPQPAKTFLSPCVFWLELM